MKLPNPPPTCKRCSRRPTLPALAATASAGLLLAISSVSVRAETLYQFTFPRGTNCSDSVRGKDGVLYMITQRGGVYGHGVLMRIVPGQSPETLYDFGTMPHDGYYPTHLIEDGHDTASGSTLTFYGTARFGGQGGHGTVFRIIVDKTNGNAAQEAILHSFSNGTDGANPASLMQARDNSLYGAAPAGGKYGFGTLFSVSPGGTFKLRHAFTFADGAGPDSAPTEDSETPGTFYGVTRGGGKSGYGTVFKFTVATGQLSTLHSFSAPDGYSPSASLVQGTTKNDFYGVTASDPTASAGTLFQVTRTGQLITRAHFDFVTVGASPNSLLPAPDGSLYGTTANGQANGKGGSGVIFHYVPGTGLLGIYSFPHNIGSNPNSLVLDNGTLYGTTLGGSVYNYGIVFSLTLAGGGMKAAPAASALSTLYACNGSNGSHPVASLVQGSDGFLYGSTSTDGQPPADAQGNPVSGAGTLFRLQPDSSSATGFTVTTLRTFNALKTLDNSNVGGAYPQTALVEDTNAPGVFYGTTQYGGVNATGTLYRFVPGGAADSSALDIVHTFSSASSDTLANAEGAYPAAALLQMQGAFYGTALYGGVNGSGTVYRFTPGGTTEAVHTFDFSDGAYPAAGLIADRHRNLFGTTGGGGAGSYGTVFRLMPDGTLDTLHAFGFTDGAAPQAALALGQDNAGRDILSGTTFYGGLGFGTTFQLTGGGGDFNTLHSFTGGADGGNPQASLLLIPTAPALSANGVGPNGIHIGGYRSLGAAYTGGGGQGQSASRLQAAAFRSHLQLRGFVTGDNVSALGAQPQTVVSGSAPPPGGVVFTQNSDGTNTQPVLTFGGRVGSNPAGALIKARDGYYYGTTEYGGAGAGTIYRVALPVIDDAAPKSPAVGKVLTLTIAGSGFVAGSQVFWNGKPLPTTVDSDSHLTAHVPASMNAPGKAVLQVGAPDGSGTDWSSTHMLR